MLLAREATLVKLKSSAPDLVRTLTSKMEAKKTFQFKTKETVMASGETYRPSPVVDGASATAALLHMVLAHTADVFHAITDAVADHYKISKDEMMEVVLQHPAYKELTISPMLNDLGYFEKKAAAEPVPQQPKKKFIVKAKAAGATTE